LQTENTVLLQEAEHFIYKCYQELGLSREEAGARFLDVKREIELTGTYEHTFVELEHGARMAWRNSNRCIGRLFWDKLRVRDERHITGSANIAESLFRHIETATNGGKIIPTLTVYRPSQPDKPDIRIWNHQLIRYAGYETEQGIVGDPISLQLTKLCRRLGWGSRGSDYDVLPLVIESDGRTPMLFSIPEKIVKQVDIDHPDIEGFAALGLRWYAVPIIADMMLSIGGIRYTAAPFNGWYMGTEIGARNFADTFRYNKLPEVAELMGLDRSSETTLWKDRALIELNAAVLYSFRRDGVSIVDHHTAAAQFKLFEERERKAGRELTGDWTWLIPPLSPAATHIFHSSYENRVVKPNFFAQEKKYASRPGIGGCPFH
jgi:nitric-oxide synthase